MVLVLVYAVRRVADYAITRPCRDSLFTVVSRGRNTRQEPHRHLRLSRRDALSGSLYKGLTGGFGAGPAAIGWLGADFVVWTVLALALGRAFQQRGRQRSGQPLGSARPRLARCTGCVRASAAAAMIPEPPQALARDFASSPVSSGW